MPLYAGLYLDYAMQAFYDGLVLLIASVMVVGLGGRAPYSTLAPCRDRDFVSGLLVAALRKPRMNSVNVYRALAENSLQGIPEWKSAFRTEKCLQNGKVPSECLQSAFRVPSDEPGRELRRFKWGCSFKPRESAFAGLGLLSAQMFSTSRC